MATAVLNVKVDSRIKSRAKQAAERLGLSLSGVVNAYLRELINTESVQFSTHRKEIPSPYLIKAIKDARKDRRLGRTVGFDNVDEAIAYLDTLGGTKRRYAN